MKYKGVEYTRDFELLTDSVVSVIAGGKFPTEDPAKYKDFLEAIHYDRFLGLIAFPTIDIELELWTKGGNYVNEATDNDNEILLSYFVCIKGKTHWGDIEWQSDDCPSEAVNVDFSLPDWEQALEKNMLDVLERYADKCGYSYTELNF